MSTDAWLTDKTVPTRKDVTIIESRWRYLGGREGNDIGVEIRGASGSYKGIVFIITHPTICLFCVIFLKLHLYSYRKVFLKR